jgi:hypothetical protein
MDLNHIKSVIEKELQSHKGLLSLTLQNHIYGCFILAEDISLKAITLDSNSQLSGPKINFSLKKQFSTIGLRFGFVLDTKLRLKSTKEYRETWMNIFSHVAATCDNSWVDGLEDLIIEVIKTTVEPTDAFFMNALETGSLTHEWIERALTLLNDTDTNDSDDDVTTVLSEANTEKAIKKPLKSIMKPLSITQRRKEDIKGNKKNFAYTRRVRISTAKE